MKRLVLCLYFIFIASFGLFSQQVLQFSESLEWETTNFTWLGEKQSLPICNTCYTEQETYLPTFTKAYPISNTGKMTAKVINPQFQALETSNYSDFIPTDFDPQRIEVNTTISIERKKPFAQVSFIPIVKRNGQWFKITDFDLEITVSPQDFNNNLTTRETASTTQSILSQGTFYRFLVKNNGIQRIDYSFLSTLGITAAVNMDDLRIYGNGGGMLPELAGADRIDDLHENPIEVFDQNNNNQFDEGDYILFYADGPNQWSAPTTEGQSFKHQTHLYANANSYFLNYDIGAGKRIQTIDSESNPNQTTDSYDALFNHEEEQFNILSGGRVWFGNQMSQGTSAEVNFYIPHLITNEDIKVELQVAATSVAATNTIALSINNTPQTSYSLPLVGQDLGSPGGQKKKNSFNYTSNSENINFTFQYDNMGENGRGWIDYISLNARAKLQPDANALSNGQLIFRDFSTVGEGNITRFNLQNPANNLRIWQLGIDQTKNINLSNEGGNTSFAVPTETLKTFIAFDGSQYFTPEPIGAIPSQNLHAEEYPEYIIVGHPSLTAQVEELADFHRENGLDVKVVYIQEVYNEFSSGTPDLTAIRDYVKMYYDRAETEDQMPKYLLLFGDCSYDYKNLNHTSETNTNLIPIFESHEPFIKSTNYCTDDYFGFLDDNEGSQMEDKNIKMDIAVGRLPVANTTLAQSVVNKIKHYKSEASLGAWSNTVTFVADDGDGNLHLEDSENHTFIVDSAYHNYNIDKIYLDAFPQVDSQGGESYPAVNTAILDKIYNGTFILNYAGHGKETGWAKESILDSRTIEEMDNIDKLPLFITATCTFTRLDEPGIESAGELLVTNPNGGAIAIVSTVRVVFAHSNKDMNETFLKNAFKKVNGEYVTLGEATRLAKNQVTTDPNNSRKFGLFGDPALTLNFPKHQVRTTKIVNESLGEETDTIQALNRVTISGEVVDVNGNRLENFNGVLTPIIYDKEQTITTLGNDLPDNYDPEFPNNCSGAEKSCPVDFGLQQNTIFRGNVSVENGLFSFNFVVPKDISYKFGKGKISYFAQSGLLTAADYDTTLVIGGISDALIVDNEGPDVSIFMNDENFVFGGLTDENPLLIVKLEDENGINTVGTGIGHDLTAFLDEEDPSKDQRLILNNNYKSELDNYQKGTAELPLFDLAPGLHTLRVKAWDVFNNSGEGYTEFVVAESANLALQRILNYPNPFMDKTTFWIEHNRPGDVLKVRIQVYTISGRVVKTLQEEVVSKSSRIDHIEWNGLDDFGNPIGRGVYVYQVTVTDSNNEHISETEKLVLLK